MSNPPLAHHCRGGGKGGPPIVLQLANSETLQLTIAAACAVIRFTMISWNIITFVKWNVIDHEGWTV